MGAFLSTFFPVVAVAKEWLSDTNITLAEASMKIASENYFTGEEDVENSSYEYEEEEIVEDTPPQVTANYQPIVIDSKEHETQTLQEVQSIIRRLKKWPELDASQLYKSNN